MKKLCLLFALLMLAGALSVPVMAAQDSKPVHISGSTYYDPAEKTFLYYVNSSAMQTVRSSAADGMITERSVSIKPDSDVALEVYLNGELLSGFSGGTYTKTGEYVVMYRGGSVAEQIFSFTIVPSLCNFVNSYSLPSGFEFVEATLDKEPVAFDGNYIKLDGEGEYNIRYRCLKTNISYQLIMETDFTGPKLALEGVENGFARGPVDISDAKRAAVVNIYHDGEKIARKDVLTQSGKYQIELADEAGNKTTYTFTILVYFDGNSWLFFGLVFMACVGVAIYLLHSRKHLRVR